MKIYSFTTRGLQNHTVKYGRMLSRRTNSRRIRQHHIRRFLESKLPFNNDGYRFYGPMFECCCTPKKPWPEVVDFIRTNGTKLADVACYELYTVKPIYDASNGGRTSIYRKLLALWNCHRLENATLVIQKT